MIHVDQIEDADLRYRVIAMLSICQTVKGDYHKCQHKGTCSMISYRLAAKFGENPFEECKKRVLRGLMGSGFTRTITWEGNKFTIVERR